MKEAGYGYAFPIVKGKDISKVWELRKAGLGVLANMKGDPKPVSLIEDTAVNVEQMPDYIDDIEKMLAGIWQRGCISCTYRNRRASYKTYSGP